MITFIGGYVVGMAAALLAVMFFSGVKRGNAAYDARTAAIERRLAAAASRNSGAGRAPSRKAKPDKATVRREPVEF